MEAGLSGLRLCGWEWLGPSGIQVLLDGCVGRVEVDSGFRSFACLVIIMDASSYGIIVMLTSCKACTLETKTTAGDACGVGS